MGLWRKKILLEDSAVGLRSTPPASLISSLRLSLRGAFHVLAQTLSFASLLSLVVLVTSVQAVPAHKRSPADNAKFDLVDAATGAGVEKRSPFPVSDITLLL
ncbi:hypothetical protein BJ138DRAFT_1129512 [Hygrophoropsis aurantiaca]|uniref:Uncharacterized protein n=1 Tax=Hygrophoropsis aurantiaca TaxID=72124 RepID=A0ACB8A1H9_9AGAM|nr:hypothetical protein BJ138DRAFT_1129512 [Hygrophoropsis aurantiaca]